MPSTQLLVIVIVSLVVVEFILRAINRTISVEYTIKPFGEFYCDAIEGGKGCDVPTRVCGGRKVGAKKDEPSLMCPPGSTINIIGAYYSVYDPFFQCAATPSMAEGSPFKLLTDACNSAGAPCACSVGTSKAEKWSNRVCGIQNQGDCRMRDATAYLGAKCNGKTSCDVTVDMPYTGPPPCRAIPPGTESSNPLHRTLPLVSGRPEELDLTNPISSTKQQGYRFTGIYTCVLDGE